MPATYTNAIPVRLTPAARNRLDLLSKMLGMEKADLIRSAIDIFLAEYQEQLDEFAPELAAAESLMAQAQRIARAGPSKLANTPSPVVFMSRPRKRSSSCFTKS